MPFLDITSAHPSLQLSLGTLRDRSLVDGRALSSSFISRNKPRLVSSWKSLSLPVKLHSNVGSFEIRRGRIVVKAVATFETKNLVQGHDEQKGNKNSHLEIGSGLTSESASDDSKEVDEKERLRRMRISKANKGKMPWNIGRKHSPETLRRIKERTKIAMQDPKVKMKLLNIGHAQTDETKEKIGVGVRRTWLRRRDRLALQETCHFEWQNLIAEASRTGYVDQEELQWDSYEILVEQLHKEWLEKLEQKKTMKPKSSRRAPKSPEQRRKIAEAIAAKWANPEYRGRVLSGISRYHGTTEKTERKPRRKPSSNTTTQPPRPGQNPPKKKASEVQISFVREDKTQTQKPRKRGPQYKDPLARSKLEMIKNIRAQRAAVESRQAEAIARARLSIAEAEKASKVLELAAETSPIAREAVLETRKLIAEAIQSIEALETGQTTAETNEEEPSDVWIELASHFEENKDDELAEDRIISGDQTYVPSYREKYGYGKVSVQDIILNDEEEFVSTTMSRKRNNLPQLNMEDLLKQLGTTPMEQPSQLESNGNIMFGKGPWPNGAFNHTIEEEKSPPRSVAKTKKWVRGRLIEVSEEDEEGNQDMSDEEEEGLSEEVEDWSLSEEEDQSGDEKEGLSEEVEDWSLSEEEGQSHDEKGLSEVEDWSQV